MNNLPSPPPRPVILRYRRGSNTGYIRSHLIVAVHGVSSRAGCAIVASIDGQLRDFACSETADEIAYRLGWATAPEDGDAA